MKFKLIIAVDAKGGIAKDGQLPWDYPEDLRHFKHMTKGGILVMGRKTLESIGRLLPDRETIVFTTDRKGMLERFPGCHPVASIEELIDTVRTLETISGGSPKPVWIAGGKQIYEMFMVKGLIDEMSITKIRTDYPCDVYMSGSEFKTKPDPKEWELTGETTNHFVGRASMTISLYKKRVFQGDVKASNISEGVL